MVNTSSQILFESKDNIFFGCFEVFFFSDRNIIPTAQELWDLICESSDSISKELQSKANLPNIHLEPPKEKIVMPQLHELVLSGYRLN